MHVKSGDPRPEARKDVIMRRIIVAMLFATTALGAGLALASEQVAIEPTAPSFIRELGTVGTATVSGTVVAVEGEHIVLDDPEDARVRMNVEHLHLEGLMPGQMITITGRLDQGELKAAHAIREDGSVAVRGALDEEEG
jgi:hypothetical protein